MLIRARARRGFTLVELVIVIVIIGILAAMAIPRLSRGARGAGSAGLQANLAIIRNALNLYQTEHGGAYPNGTAANIVAQLTTYTNYSGTTNATRTTLYIYGPYLAAIPPCPVGENAGSNVILVDNTNNPPTPNPGAAGSPGWVYNGNVGIWLANTTMTDDTGKAYNTY